MSWQAIGGWLPESGLAGAVLAVAGWLWRRSSRPSPIRWIVRRVRCETRALYAEGLVAELTDHIARQEADIARLRRLLAARSAGSGGSSAGPPPTPPPRRRPSRPAAPSATSTATSRPSGGRRRPRRRPATRSATA